MWCLRILSKEKNSTIYEEIICKINYPSLLKQDASPMYDPDGGSISRPEGQDAFREEVKPHSDTEVLITDVVAPANWRLLEQMDQNGRGPES